MYVYIKENKMDIQLTTQQAIVDNQSVQAEKPKVKALPLRISALLFAIPAIVMLISTFLLGE